MKGILYRNFHIIGTARKNDKTGHWVPMVRVRWRDGGQDQQFELAGPQNRFTTRDEAEDFALTMGKDWIDKKSPLP